MCGVIVFNGFWTVEDVKSNRDCLFVFGDNDVHRGKMGQAIIRDEVNTIGIPTKKFPSNRISSFYTDDEYSENIKKIDKSIEKIIELSKDYRAIVIPRDGFGTGLAKLHIYAPKTLKYINDRIDILKND